MFGIAPSELMLLAAVALVVVGPKDFPRVLRATGQWAGRMRSMTRQLRSNVDQFVSDLELAEVENGPHQAGSRQIRSAEAGAWPQSSKIGRKTEKHAPAEPHPRERRSDPG